MKVKFVFATATAVGLLMSGGAFAGGGNSAYITQDGSANSSSITQNSGAANGNQAGSSTDSMKQSGTGNVLTIVQYGDQGQIGAKSGSDHYDLPGATSPFDIDYNGLDQQGSGKNSASLTQNGNSSFVGSVQQTSNGGGTGGQLTTTQTGQNYINHITQLQDAYGAENIANVTESGSGNTIDRIDQYGHGYGSPYKPNTITVNISGSNNGTVDRDPGTPLTGFYGSIAYQAGATQSSLIQNNYDSSLSNVYGNSINLTITGSYNQYGMTQKGTNNSSGLVTIGGDANDFGSYQAGDGNTITAGAINGSYNDSGIWQNGNTNTAQMSVLNSGDNYNTLGIAQGGDSNYGHIMVDGSHNSAGVAEIGNSNFAEISQVGTYSQGTIVLNGNDNGSGSLAGVAQDLNAQSGWLNTGELSQGSNINSYHNVATYTVYGDSNEFALAQLGSNNKITGTVGGIGAESDGNSAAVLQSGSGNTAVFSQTGTGGNIVAINQ
jgi:hypothetical protein